MSNTINLGIDLGTTNSAIARFVRGEVEVFKNPADYGRSTLPSVVGFRKDTIYVGSKAKERVEKDPQNVASAFKRKMGTNETFPIKTLDRSIGPVELSAHVLKELKGFAPKEAAVDAAVITIPASFDTIQSNATKRAGYEAGFQQVVLLQEPIAASLAYANKAKAADLTDGRWLVYDLGGGTFDVALLETRGDEMKVLDHEGDNFLGGTDFDRLIVEEVVFPVLNERYAFDGLEDQMRGRSGRLNGVYYALLHQAEKAKVALSSATSAEIEAERFEDDEGEEVMEVVTVSRSEFERLIQPAVDRSVEMVKTVLTRNGLAPRDLGFVLMVGGSTYIPYVRQRVEEVVGVPVNTDIDPTTAVAIGAAYYAGTKVKDLAAKEEGAPKAPGSLRVKLAYHKASQDTSELLAARLEGDLDGLSYRITRDDAGFDTGVKPAQPQIVEELPLVVESYNFFTLTITDAQGNAVDADIEPIGIAQGKFGVAGQPLPHDISLERDDVDDPDDLLTTLDPVLTKNEVLPLRRTKTYTLNRTIAKGSDDAVLVRVLEGPSHVLPESNQCIGHLEISGAMLSRDAVKGSDIEVTLEMSESRDLTVTAYLAMTDQEFRQVFQPQERSTTTSFLIEQVARTARVLQEEVEAAVSREDYETAQALRPLEREVKELQGQANRLVEDDVTDVRYQLEDQIRSVSKRMDEALSDKRLQQARHAYEDAKERCQGVVSENGNDNERRMVEGIVAQEPAFLSSNNPAKIREKADELLGIMFQVLRRTPEFQQRVFVSLAQEASRMNDPEQAKNLVAAGRYAIENGDWDRLAEVNFGLFDLLPQRIQNEKKSFIGF